MSGELGVQYFLHKAGYTYFNMNRLTYKQIRQITDGFRVVEKGEGA